MPTLEEDRASQPQLAQKLGSYQIFFIGLTVVIGSGVFIDYGSTTKTAGSGGLLVAFLIVSTLAIAAMDGLSEMIQLFPTVNPIVELTHEFVDPELARLTGFAYWFAYCSFMAVQLSRAAAYLDFYVESTAGWEYGKIVTFYILFPLIIVLLNIAPVKMFGYIESLSGLIKLLILGIVISMCMYIAGESRVAVPFDNPFRSRLAGSGLSRQSALCLSIEFIAFSFCGIEAVAVTTFEAKNAAAVRISSQTLALAVSAIYLLSAISQILLLDWGTATCVHSLDESLDVGTCSMHSRTRSAIIIAAVSNGNYGMARAMNGMFIFCAFSAANSCLYVSSRMLFGIAYSNSEKESAWLTTKRFWAVIAHLTPKKVPIYAVLISAIIFCWVPFTQIKHSEGANRLIPWFTNAGSLCVIFVWGTVNLAFVRYYFWFKWFRKLPVDGELARSRYLRLNRECPEKGCSTLLSWAQPVVSIYALIGSYIIVFVLAGAGLWRPPGEVDASIFFQYFTIPIFLPVMWILLKVNELVKLAAQYKKPNDSIIKSLKRGWPHLSWYRYLGHDVGIIKKSITTLTMYLKPDQMEHVQRLRDGAELEPLNGVLSEA